MEAIRQNGKIILHGNDGISIKMIFKKLTGRNFQGQEYVEYIRHIAIGDMGFSTGIIEHCRNGEVVGKGTIPNVWKALKAKIRWSCGFIGFSSSDSYCLWYIQQRKLSLSPFEQHGMPFSLVVAESDILPIDVPVARLQLSDQRTFGYLPAPQKTVRTDIIGKCGK